MPEWQLKMGARVLGDGRVLFRVYAPVARSVHVELYPPGAGMARYAMSKDGNDVWHAELNVPTGSLYRYWLDETWGYADPYSRSQPEGVHGPSQVVDSAFNWTDNDWRGPDRDALVIYELHVGTYTPEGTFDAVIPRLDALRDLGVTMIELMPVGEFPGWRNWGYDGAHRFAPESSYGRPEGLRRLVDAAHARGLAVLLDVVYNHLGPDGDYLHMFAPNVLTERYETPWGRATNFDGDGSAFVRQYVIDNVLYWMHEFHIDGFRLDAAHEIYDRSEPHILRELADAVHRRAPDRKRCVIIGEHERHDMRLIASPDAGGYGLDALWVDDFHHSLHVRLTGEHSGYLDAYEGTLGEIARLLNDGSLYADHTEAKHTSSRAVIFCLQNHDQIGNRLGGTRLTEIVGVDLYKAVYALLLLLEETPLLFMGDEYAASTPFLYFADNTVELAGSVRAGRAAKFATFWEAHAGRNRSTPDAQAEATFSESKLDWSEALRVPNSGVRRLFTELIRLRREDVVFGSTEQSRAEAAGDEVLVVERGKVEKRLIVVNLGDAVSFVRQGRWVASLCTAEARFAGPGADLGGLRIEEEKAVQLPPRSTTVWCAEPES